MIDVVCVTKGDIQPKGLEFIPSPHRLMISTEPGWGQAANALLDKTENDVLFLDDDIEILPSTFDTFERYRDDAEMFGFSLLGPCGERGEWIQSAGQMLLKNEQGHMGFAGLDRHARALTLPCYIAHVGTCLAYIKREVIAAGIRFPIWQGIHHEDVAFCLSVWLEGMRCLRLPSPAIHHGAANGAGATKGADPEFDAKRAINGRNLMEWCKLRAVSVAVDEGTIPFGFHLMGGTKA